MGLGRWTQDEHERFLAGLKLYGKNWYKVQQHVGTRKAEQVRSHAQKFFKLMKKTGTKVEIYEPVEQEPVLLFKVEKHNKRTQKMLDKESMISSRNDLTLPSSDSPCGEQIDSGKANQPFQTTLDGIRGMKVKAVTALSLAMPALF